MANYITVLTSNVITIVLALLFLFYNTLATIEYFLDTEGNPVVNGGIYSMSPYMPGPNEGPITWDASNNSQACPLNVILNHDKPASPLDTLITINSPSNSKYIPLRVKFDIHFNITTSSTPCKGYLKWSVKSAMPDIDAYYVVAGDVESRNNGSFKVVKATHGGYYLLYCFNKESCLGVVNTCAFNNPDILSISGDPSKQRNLRNVVIAVQKH